MEWCEKLPGEETVGRVWGEWTASYMFPSRPRTVAQVCPPTCPRLLSGLSPGPGVLSVYGLVNC